MTPSRVYLAEEGLQQRVRPFSDVRIWQLGGTDCTLGMHIAHTYFGSESQLLVWWFHDDNYDDANV